MSDSEHDWLRPEEETESETIIDARTAQNNPEVADVVAKIASLRQSIDNVDAAIVSLLAERFKYTSQVGETRAYSTFSPEPSVFRAPRANVHCRRACRALH